MSDEKLVVGRKNIAGQSTADAFEKATDVINKLDADGKFIVSIAVVDESNNPHVAVLYTDRVENENYKSFLREEVSFYRLLDLVRDHPDFFGVAQRPHLQKLALVFDVLARQIFPTKTQPQDGAPPAAEETERNDSEMPAGTAFYVTPSKRAKTLQITLESGYKLNQAYNENVVAVTVLEGDNPPAANHEEHGKKIRLEDATSYFQRFRLQVRDGLRRGGYATNQETTDVELLRQLDALVATANEKAHADDIAGGLAEENAMLHKRVREVATHFEITAIGNKSTDAVLTEIEAYARAGDWRVNLAEVRKHIQEETERQKLIETISMLFPPDGGMESTRRTGRGLFAEAMAQNWRTAPLDVLRLFAELCEQREADK